MQMQQKFKISYSLKWTFVCFYDILQFFDASEVR